MWVYPAGATARAPENVFVTDKLDEKALDLLTNGTKDVLFMPNLQWQPSQPYIPAHYSPINGDKLEAPPTGADTNQRRTVRLRHNPVFWNTVMFTTQPSQTLGFVCNSEHAVFKEFPTSSYPDWQWQEIMNASQAFVLSSLPDIKPILQPIDNPQTNRRLGVLFEGKVGKGKLLVCGIDLQSLSGRSPAARQLLVEHLFLYERPSV